MKSILVLALFASLAVLPSQAATEAAQNHAKAEKPTHISHGDKVALHDYLVTGKVTIFDFYSEYCPPCRALSPVLEKLHTDRKDLAVVKVDINRPDVTGIDWSSPVARQYDLHYVPFIQIYNPDGTLKAEGDEARALIAEWTEGN